MPKPRKSLISLDATSYYHCVSRCVRRAFLCGEDSVTGQSFEHRREWVRNRLFELVNTFAMEVCGYAVMSNHYHLVLYVDQDQDQDQDQDRTRTGPGQDQDQDQAKEWSAREVIERWHHEFAGHYLSHCYLRGDQMTEAERQAVDALVAEWRSRLMDINWFMRRMNESIAREANAEDGCTGRFWEGRFKSQALLDETALMACLAYVDLNPIRAAMAKTPEGSDYTSIQERSQKAQIAHSPNHPQQQPKRLLPFAGNPREEMAKGLPFRLTDYLELVDWTGRAILETKRGSIPAQLPPILDRLQIDPKHWLYVTQNFESKFKGLVGKAFKLKQAC